MVFEKALSRKAFGSEASTQESGVEHPDANGTASLHKDGSRVAHSFWKYLAQSARILRLDKLKKLFSSNLDSGKQSSRASMGKILNLIRQDITALLTMTPS